MLKLLSLALAFAVSPAFAADGVLKFSANDFGIYWDLDQNANVISGSITSSGGPFVKLTKGDKGWQGRFGGVQVAETKVTENADKSLTVDVNLLPRGFYSFRFVHKEGKGMTINGTNPNGRLISGQMSHKNHEFSVGIGSRSLYLRPTSEGKFRGGLEVGMGNPHYSDVSLSTTGTLDFHKMLHQDPALFALLFITTLD